MKTVQENVPRTIYGLYDPDGRLRYVGITTQRLEDRLRGHLHECSQAARARGEWIDSLRERGLRPEIRALEVIWGDHKAGEVREGQWMIWATYAGANLLNHYRIDLDCARQEMAGCSDERRQEIEAFRQWLKHERPDSCQLEHHPGGWTCC